MRAVGADLYQALVMGSHQHDECIRFPDRDVVTEGAARGVIELLECEHEDCPGRARINHKHFRTTPLGRTAMMVYRTLAQGGQP